MDTLSAPVSGLPLTLAGPERPVSAPTDPVSGQPLTTDGRERPATAAALTARTDAPATAHGSNDNAVRRATQATARSRRW